MYIGRILFLFFLLVTIQTKTIFKVQLDCVTPSPKLVQILKSLETNPKNKFDIKELQNLVDTQIKHYKSLEELLTAQGNNILNIVDSMRTLDRMPQISYRVRRELQNIKDYIDQLIENRNEIAHKSYTLSKNNLVGIDEKEFLVARKKKSHQALEKFLGIKIKPNKIPTIAFCTSGGGYRSMVGTCGALLGADQIGLLDIVTYISCLSGSAWGVYPWLLKQSQDPSYTIAKAVDNLSDTMFDYKRDPFLMKSALKEKNQCIEIMCSFFTRYYLNEPVSFVDFYGILIGNALLRNLFGTETFKQSLHSMATFAKSGASPLPIGTATITNNDCGGWLEVTPFTVGSQYLNASVSTAAFGSQFYKCKSAKTVASYTADFFLGLFGSNFSINKADFLAESGTSADITNCPIVGELLKRYEIYPLSEKSKLAQVNNFTYKCPGTQLSTNETLSLTDAGTSFNLPLPPLLNRNVDIIIIIDMSHCIEQLEDPLEELRKAVDYCAANKIECPIAYKNLTAKVATEPYTIFKNSKQTIIYIPWCFKELNCINSWCKTLNWNYSKENIQDLAINCMATRVKNANQVFVNEIKNTINRKI
ncbi:hypothetical protein A3F06_04320 [candidate division TM6 bacterium RIFCSPHIGHO2_12_FULL_36_22]|nr:MAG: hypothetical protein A3F06_04320 [candidate division TM6 bacterium RIFCSPHIGHO2_12_FULL_36_22]